MAGFFSKPRIAPFKFKSQTHFVASSDGTTLQVYELTKMIPPSSIQKTNLTQVANIHPQDPRSTATKETRMTCNGLQFPDGRGKIEGKEALTTLAHHLSQLRLLVNPYGYCLQDMVQLRVYTNYQIHYLRLNDLFCWSTYGVRTASITRKTSTTHDDRSKLNHRAPASEIPITRYKVISKDEDNEQKEKLLAAKKANEEQRKILEEKEKIFATELKKKDEEVKKWAQISKQLAENEELMKQKESEIERLEKEKEQAEEYKKEWIDYAKSYIPPVYNGGAAVLDAAKYTATGIGTVLNAFGTAGKKKASEIATFIAANTPAARAAAAAAEVERVDRRRRRNMARRFAFPGPPPGHQH